MSRRGAFSSGKRCLLFAGAALAVLGSAAAQAQTDYTQLQPPARAAPDTNGVDLISGQLMVPVEGVAIGVPGQSGMAYAANIQLTQLDPAQ